MKKMLKGLGIATGIYMIMCMAEWSYIGIAHIFKHMKPGLNPIEVNDLAFGEAKEIYKEYFERFE